MPIVLVEMVEMPKMKAAENSNVPQLSEKSRDHLKTGPVLDTQSFLQQHRLFVHILYVQCRSAALSLNIFIYLCSQTIEVVDLNQRRWTIIALKNLIFYFWSNIELTWHECSFMPQITNYKEKIMGKQFWNLF